MSEAIISFKNVSKEYTLYKNDQERFRALFFKPRNAKINKALKNVTFDVKRGESIGIIGSPARARFRSTVRSRRSSS